MSDADAARPVTITREELYAQVWQTPMSRLATQYGITGNGLAKICDKLKIPYPPRGHWAKKAAGKKVVTLRLTEVEAATPKSVTITPTPPTAKIGLPIAVQERMNSAISGAAEIVVHEKLTQPHRIIAGWIKNHEQRRQEARRERDPWRKKHLDPGEWSETDHRKHRILDTLFKTLEANKGNVKFGERGEIFVTVEKEDIEIQLREKQKQIKRPLTEDEKRYGFHRDRGWVQELQPNGILNFSIKTHLWGKLRSEWIEGSKNTMESFLPEIFATLLAAGPLLAQQRGEREEAEKKRQIAERKRYEEQQRRKREDNRWRRFIDFANSWSEVEKAQAFLSALKSADRPEGTIDGKTLNDWIAWADDRLRDRDPLRNGLEGIFGAIAAITEWNYRD